MTSGLAAATGKTRARPRVNPTPIDRAARPAPEAARADLELCVVAPTFNERANIVRLIEALSRSLEGIAWELVIVDDDSPDGTADLAREFARRDRRVRVLHRIGRRGLASACIEGMRATAAPYIAVIDADLQHDETRLPVFLQALKTERLDLVVGSRYLAGGATGNWPAARLRASRLASWLSRTLLAADLSDPMSGFFVIRRAAMEGALRNVSGFGFKILLDLVASSPRALRLRELPYRFRERQAGESKLDLLVVWQFLMLLWEKRLGTVLPARFASFCAVGAAGVLVHFAILSGMLHTLDGSFVWTQATAALAAMSSNFLLNNLLTYRDQRLHGRRLLRGWITFTLACSLGALANVGVAAHLFASDTFWALSALAGITVGAVWNYAVTSFYTWEHA